RTLFRARRFSWLRGGSTVMVNDERRGGECISGNILIGKASYIDWLRQGGSRNRREYQRRPNRMVPRAADRLAPVNSSKSSGSYSADAIDRFPNRIVPSEAPLRVRRGSPDASPDSSSRMDLLPKRMVPKALRLMISSL
ncbi:hypothetical protein PENTCL1PPCAC_30084, partial [Pristionchus entomophagus]